MSPWKCRAEESGENSHSEFSPLPSALGSRRCRDPHFHRDGGGSLSSRHRLLKNHRALQEAFHIGGAEDLRFQPLFHRSP